MPYERPPTYRDWLDHRHDGAEEEDDDLEVEVETEPAEDDGFPLHDDYSEESSP